MKDLNSWLKGPSRRGESWAGMRNRARMGWRSACGGLPVAICESCRLSTKGSGQSAQVLANKRMYSVMTGRTASIMPTGASARFFLNDVRPHNKCILERGADDP